MPIAAMLAGLVGLLFSLASAGASATTTPEFNVTAWSTDQGLPQNSVICLAQSRDGYLWLGTINGLVRYDGVRFKLFDESNIPLLNSSPIIKVFEDSRGNLWVGTETGGTLLVNPRGDATALDIGKGAESRLVAICEDTSGAVWLYTANGSLCRYRDGQVNVWKMGADFAGICRGMIADTSGLLWIGTDWTLSAIDVASIAASSPLPYKHQFGVPRHLDLIAASPAGGYWRFAAGSIQKCLGPSVERDYGAYPWSTNMLVSAACEDKAGNLFVGTYGEPGEGVYRFDTFGHWELLHGLSYSSILSLLVDREDSLWVGTDGGGLNRVKPFAFETVPASAGLTVQSVAGHPDGGVWFGINGGGVGCVRDGATSFYREQEGLGNLYVRSVLVDAQQRLWAGTFGGGIYQFDSGRFAPVRDFDVANQQVSAIYQDHQGMLWVGTEGGLAWLDGARWKTFTTLDGLSGNSVRAIVEDPAGSLWIGTGGAGLNCITNRSLTTTGTNLVSTAGPGTRPDWRVQRFGRSNGLPSDNVTALLVDRAGTLWVGTSGGLARRRGERFDTFTTANGLLGNSIRYLVEDPEDNVWIGCNTGLMRVSREALDSADPRTALPLRGYGKVDGLPASECTPGSQPGAVVAGGSRLWFPTIRGLASLVPAKLIRNTNPPPVLIESVYVDRVRQHKNALRASLPDVVLIPADKESLEIDFSILSLSAPNHCRFEYQLENYEPTWTAGEGASGAIRYRKLPPGEYQFRVRGCNEDGVWNSTAAILPVKVSPPFWRTWWFIALSTILTLVAVIGSVHFASTQKLQRQLAVLRQKEALEKERSRISRDLHDQLGANLTQVALLGEMVEADKALPEEVETHARQISQTARETTRSLDEIVWTVNPSNDTLDGLVNYLCKYAQDYFGIAGLRYRFDIPETFPPSPITPELRHNVFLAAKEAINNVVKHARAKSAWLAIEIGPGRVTIDISDDGRGISPEDEKKGRNGLVNMSRRLKEVGGDFSFIRRAEGGTTIRLVVPVVSPGENRTGAS